MSLIALTFLGVFFGGLLMALVRQPIYGLYVYIAAFYLDPPNRWWAADLPDIRWSFVAAAVTLFGALVTRSRRAGQVGVFSHAPVLLFCVFVAWMWLTTLWAAAPEPHWFGLLVYSKYLLVIYLFYVLVDSRDRLGSILLAHALGCFYLGLLAWTSVSGGGRLDGIGGPGINDANSLAMQVATGVFAAAAYYFARRDWQRFLAVPVVPFALNTLVMAGSRGGFLALLAGGLAFYLFRPEGQQRVVLPYAIVGVLLLGYVASDTFIERMSTLTQSVESQADADASVATRLVLFEAQWQMALDHPMGVGNGGTAALSYSYLDPRYHSMGGGRASHNSFMSALVEQGFLGALLWLGMVWGLVVRLRAHRRWCNRRRDVEAGWLNAGLAAMFAVVIVAGMFSPQARTEVFVWILALVCAFVNIRRNEARIGDALALEESRELGENGVPTVVFDHTLARRESDRVDVTGD